MERARERYKYLGETSKSSLASQALPGEDMCAVVPGLPVTRPKPRGLKAAECSEQDERRRSGTHAQGLCATTAYSQKNKSASLV